MPELSIVVPTRERSDTLFHAIRTLVNQDYQDFEILISDNASLDATKEVVESFRDPRIRYVNTGRRVSMSENWEFALRQARGEFITYIGDDDGFIPGAVTRAMRLLEKSRMSALVWMKASYRWPDYVEEGLRNLIALPAGDSQIHVVDGLKKLGKVLSFRSAFEYYRLPCPYNGIIRKSLFDKVTESSASGVFFSSISPDVFSGIALSMVTGRYLLSEYPFSVSGFSRHSIGASYNRQASSSPDSPSAKFDTEVSIRCDDRLKTAPCDAIFVMTELLLAKKAFPGLKFPEPPWNRYVELLIRYASSVPCSDEILESASHTVKMCGLKINVPERVEVNRISQPAAGLHNNVFTFSVPVDMVSNIYDACQLIGGMVPNPRLTDNKAPLSRFVRNVYGNLIAEAKTLYRST